MEDIGLFKQAWKWIQSQKHATARIRIARDRVAVFAERYWPVVCCWCCSFGNCVLHLLLYWRDSILRGCRSLIGFGPAALLLIMWSCFLNLTSMSCLVYVVISMGAVGAAIQYLGFTPGLFIVRLFAILLLWMYANFWITGTLFIIGGYLFSLNHARLVVLMATLSSMTPMQNESSTCKVIKEETSSLDEMKRIMDSTDHYEALGFTRHKKVDEMLLKKEYRRKAMLVHPDKN